MANAAVELGMFVLWEVFIPPIPWEECAYIGVIIDKNQQAYYFLL